MPVALALFFSPALKQEATIVLCFRALDIKFHPVRGLVEFFKDLLELLGRDEVDRGATAGRHEEEDTPQHDIELLDPSDHRVYILQVVPRNRGIDLHGKPDLTRPAHCA